MHHLLIRWMTGLSYWDRAPMVSVLVCMVTHWIRPRVNHDVRRIGFNDSRSYQIVWIFNLERTLTLC